MVKRLKKQVLNEPVLNHARRDFTTLKPEQTVESALASLRTQQLAEKIVYFYVVDDERKLCGVVPTRRLLMGQPDEMIGTLMVQNLVTIPASATVLDACEFFTIYRFLAFPVVDEQRRMLGVVDINLFTEEIFDVAEARSIDALFQLIGVHVAQARTGSPWDGFRNRFPWLLANITGGILCALVAGLYEAFLDQVIVLALFIPIVLALAESVSIQAMTITLQGFIGPKVNWSMFARGLGKEFLTATLLGLASGGTVAAVTWLWKGHAVVALAIWGSITLSMVTACILGAVLPTTVHAVGGDPKIAAGPLVLAITDVATLLFYFNLAGLLLR
jgi:magnesium transporter